jgi:hypothetical protein
MEKLLAQTDLAKILEKAPLLAQLTAVIQEYAHLSDMNETMILEHYMPAIVNDNTTPFTDFTQLHRDAYMRLRFRADNRRQGVP